jgi:hypothetical protein
MLILSIVLDLSTKQVDSTAAFVHEPIDRSPNYNKMSEEEKAESDVFVAMPQGFTTPNKVLRLRKLLYGLKQAPQNFFMHLKSKLESIGFETKEDLDPCLFISSNVICLVYVDDILFFSPKAEYIDEVIERLRKCDMELEVEGEVAGFLGVHIVRNQSNTTITLTQIGLIKRIIEAVGASHLSNKYTPASSSPLVKDLEGDPCDGTFNYRSVIGMLQYLQNHSRPDITYAFRFVRASHTILGVYTN